MFPFLTSINVKVINHPIRTQLGINISHQVKSILNRKTISTNVTELGTCRKHAWSDLKDTLRDIFIEHNTEHIEIIQNATETQEGP